MRRQRVSLPSTSVYSPSICCHLEARSDRGFTHREETRIPSKGQNNINAATLLAPLIFKVQALHDLLIQVVQPPSEHRRERLSVPLVLIAMSGLLSSLSILFLVSTIVGVLSVVIAVVVLRRYVQQATKEACVRECEERSEAFCFCYDKPKIHIMQLTKHPTYLPGQHHLLFSLISMHPTGIHLWRRHRQYHFRTRWEHCCLDSKHC